MNEQVSDEYIIGEVLKGKREVFAVLVDKYKSGLYAFLLRMGASDQDAQDLAQDTFIMAYQKLHNLSSNCSFVAWLYAIAINRFRDLKRRKRFSFGVNSLLLEKDQSPTPEEQYMRKEEKLEIHKKLAKLPERYRIVLLLRYTNELTYEEISDITGMTMHQVKNRLFRARQKLKKQWPQAKEDSNEKMGIQQTR
ncbi:RNA polymerase sigma factor [Paenibacillus durus]|uniref:RNA polymerase sigma factor n=1 Tax=Paenibacillus durus ATCC 35681 TaxID=1333534 RepID=A0A0F7CIH2_PAEDU|nr:sigma-70 family RNA polymerase sigma factor [Paenibacillus durus]AKG34630.1 hypothetical protein VK70_08600 [Paenibacillus durus ATCC 35681]